MLMKSFFKHPIIASIISAFIIGAIVTPIVAYVKSQSFYEAIKTIGVFIIKILTYGVSVWILIIIGIMYFFLIKMVKRFSANIDLILLHIQATFWMISTGSGAGFNPFIREDMISKGTHLYQFVRDAKGI